MQQFSTNGRHIELEVLSGHLLFIDPLYFQDITDNYHQIDKSSVADKKQLVKFFEDSLFPDGGGGLLGYKHIDSGAPIFLFEPMTLTKRDRKNKDENIAARNKDITTFSVDTASFLIIVLDNLNKLIEFLTYDDLIDALLSKKLDIYFGSINHKIKNKGWAYIVSEGVDNGNAFDGDGSYILP